MGTNASGRCLVSRTWETVAWDWRGSKDIYSEWSKLGVERLLGGLNGGGLRVVALRVRKTSRLSPRPARRTQEKCALSESIYRGPC